MGSVYLAEDTELGRKVALKVAHVDTADNPDILERFEREARAAALLDHPYLCPLHEVGVSSGIHYIIMAYIEGQSLAELIDGRTGLPARQVAALVGKLAVALHEAHQRGVYHRDLKPSSIMIKPTARGKEPVIVDFGLAHVKTWPTG
jgi:serine/threonine protein kinase